MSYNCWLEFFFVHKSHLTDFPQAAAWAEAEPEPAEAYEHGLGFSFIRLRPRKAELYWWLSGWAEPAQHYMSVLHNGGKGEKVHLMISSPWYLSCSSWSYLQSHLRICAGFSVKNFNIKKLTSTDSSQSRVALMRTHPFWGIQSFLWNPVESFLAGSPTKIAIPGANYSGGIEPFRNWDRNGPGMDWNRIWQNAIK